MKMVGWIRKDYKVDIETNEKMRESLEVYRLSS